MAVADTAHSYPNKDARIAELEAVLAARDTLIETLRLQLDKLRRMTFAVSPRRSLSSRSDNWNWRSKGWRAKLRFPMPGP